MTDEMIQAGTHDGARDGSVERVVSRRMLLRAAALGLGSVAAGPILWRTPGHASVPNAGVHVNYGADPLRQLAVSWSTAEPVSGLRCEIGPSPQLGRTIAVRTETAAGVDTLYHHAQADKLVPGQRYHYRLSHNGGAAFRGTFTTAPAKSEPFRFVTFGDMGVSAGAAAVTAQIQAAKPALCFMVGDLCYADLSGGSMAPLPHNPAVWDAWLAQIAASTSAIPWMTTVGNHEIERENGELGYDGYLARFSLPGNGAAGAPVTYSFRHSNVGFVALDGNDASYEIATNRDYVGAVQDVWLRQTLSAFRADPAVDFVVVGFHNCMYCTNVFHGSDGGNRSRWEGIFDEYSVDLVVNGHNHCYERTHPMRGGQVVNEVPAGGKVEAAQGTTYITAGGGGSSEYPTSGYPASYVVTVGGIRVPELALWSATRYLAHSFVVADVAPAGPDGMATMTLRAIAKDGSQIETVTLRRASARGPAPVALGRPSP